MMELGIRLARDIVSDQVIALVGDLGAGKTTLAKGVICGLTGISVDEVTSPTFQYVCLYEGNNRTVAHFDLWRLFGEEDFLALGLDEFLLSPISLIEWPDRIVSLLPTRTLFITSRVFDGGRKVIVGDQHGTA
jgi:tRNA threonylcarbamoyl adenosine modification protein YjeE